MPVAKKEGYTFVSWNGSIAGDSTVTDLDIAYTANFIITSYTVTFNDWDGTQLKQQSIDHGSAATAPADPTRTGYTFTGWDVDFSNITADTTITAMYLVSYTVIFNDWDGTELERQTVVQATSATAPANPSRTGYTFTAWDTDFSNVTSDLIVTAEYTPAITGINDVSGLNYSFYPNPVSNILSIEIPVISNISTIEIFDITGKTLYKSTDTSEGLMTIDLSASPGGLLLIKTTDAKGNVSIEKLFKN